MVVIGLTGGIGTGKSVVAGFLRELGAAHIDADRLGHEAYQPGTPGWREVVAVFGEQVLQPNGEVDRKKLGALVFNDPSQLARLNAILHPLIYQMAQQRIQQLQSQGHHVIVLEAAVLIEAGWTPLVDEVWVTVADEAAVVRRVQERNGLPEEAIRARIRAQLPPEDRLRHATVVINNSGSAEELRQQVLRLWNQRIVSKVKAHDP